MEKKQEKRNGKKERRTTKRNRNIVTNGKIKLHNRRNDGNNRDDRKRNKFSNRNKGKRCITSVHYSEQKSENFLKKLLITKETFDIIKQSLKK